jgi:hypothetical protein
MLTNTNNSNSASKCSNIIGLNSVVHGLGQSTSPNLRDRGIVVDLCLIYASHVNRNTVLDVVEACIGIVTSTPNGEVGASALPQDVHSN